MKKTLVIAAAAVMAVTLCSCTFSFTKTETKTVTDANGNTTTTTTTTTNTNKNTAAKAAADGEQHKASVTIINDTDADIDEFYVAAPEDESWGSNLIAMPIDAGDDTEGRDFTMTYDADSLSWEIHLVDSNDVEHTFDWDLSDCDAEDMTIEFTLDDDDAWIQYAY